MSVVVRPWRQWTVRVRIVASVVVLAGLALIAADGIGVGLLNWYLMKKIDDQLVVGIGPRGGFGPGFVLPTPNPSVTAPGVTPSSSATGFRRDPSRTDFRPGPDYQTYRFDPTGKLTTTEPVLVDPALFGDLATRARQAAPFTVHTPSGDWRVRVFAVTDLGYVARAISMVEAQDTRDKMLAWTSGASAILLLLVGVATAALVRVALSPLTRMEQTAVEIADGNLSSRVVDADPHTESGRLGTALNTMLARIEEAVDDSAESERRLRQFLADAAHELRTPLTSVQGFAELYRRGGAPPGPALDEAMSCIEAEVFRMRLLVNDLLTLARLDEERPHQEFPVDLLAVAADAVRDAHVRVPTRFVQLSALDDRAGAFEPVTIAGDEARMRQVVANLVSNALQHTPEETRVVVRVGRAVQGGPPPTAAVGATLPEGGQFAAIEVSDTGPGMATDDATRVFERLYRAEGSRSRRHGGAGLGLAIVAAIVQAHGGRVELWTGPGAGARFRVLLPVLANPDFDDVDFTDVDVDLDAVEVPASATRFRGNSEEP